MIYYGESHTANPDVSIDHFKNNRVNRGDSKIMFNDQSEIIHCSYIDDLSDKLHARVSESDEHNSANSFVERNNSYEDSDKFSSIFGNISINLFSFQE